MTEARPDPRHGRANLHQTQTVLRKTYNLKRDLDGHAPAPRPTISAVLTWWKSRNAAVCGRGRYEKSRI